LGGDFGEMGILRPHLSGLTFAVEYTLQQWSRETVQQWSN